MAAMNDYFTVGSIVWCRTCYERELEGEVLAFDPQTKILILKCPSLTTTSLNNVHFVNLSLVSGLQVKREVNNTVATDVPQSLDLKRLTSRIQNEVDKKRHLLHAISANVSVEGQSLFVAIAKTIKEVRWRNADIVIWDQEVVISPPYQLENIRYYSQRSKDYGFIRKLVERHMRTLRTNNNNNSSSSSNNGTDSRTPDLTPTTATAPSSESQQQQQQ